VPADAHESDARCDGKSATRAPSSFRRLIVVPTLSYDEVLAVPVNAIDVVEEAYRWNVDDHAWLKGIATAIRPLVDGGLGTIAFRYDLAVPSICWQNDSVVLDCDPMILVAGLRAIDFESRTGPMCRAKGPWHACARWGSIEAVILGTAPRRGLAFVGLHPRPRLVDRRFRRLWVAVASHLTDAYRIRCALACRGVTEPQPEETLASCRGAGGKLRDVVQHHERVRTRIGKAECERAVATWRAVMDGRWSLVDHFERDGRRYLVARANSPDRPAPRTLTERERAVVHLVGRGKPNKLVARELGLAQSTVASHLTTALRKLGLGSRTELAGVLSSLTDDRSTRA
jgi:DNA-binding CsgD family transcriptional regulator